MAETALLALAPGRGVVDAKRHAALIDPVEAVGGANARTDILFAAFDDFLHDIGVGHMGAGHADHIKLAGLNGVARRRHIGDAGGVEGGQTNLGLNAAGKIQMRGGFHALNGDNIGHRRWWWWSELPR